MKTTLFPSKLDKIVEVSPSPQKSKPDPHKRLPLSSLLPQYKLISKKSENRAPLNKADQQTCHQNEKQKAQKKIQKLRTTLANPKMAYEKRTNNLLKQDNNLEENILRIWKICFKINTLHAKKSGNSLNIMLLLLKRSVNKVDKIKLILAFILKWISSILNSYSFLVKQKLKLDYF